MPSLPVSRRRALVLAAAALVLLVVAGRTLAGAGAAGSQPVAALVPEHAAAAPKLVVHVAGAVRRPGLYRLAEGKRVADAVARAGGATAPADTAAINLAAPLADGMQVVVPSRVAGRAVGATGEAAAGRVSLSSASVAELDALPGVGPVTAQKIVDHRLAHGGFRSVDDLDAIPGIGPARIEQLRELRVAMIDRRWPTLVVLAACLGLALANGVRAPGFVLGLVVLAAVAAAVAPRARLPACVLALALAGWWFGSERLGALDRSLLEPELGRSEAVTAVVTGPVRKTPFALRVPAEVRRFGGRALNERVLLELPVGRSPPQGAVLALRAKVDAPRGPEDGFDERGWLARRGVHVVLHGGDWRIVGRRGGIGGVSDRLRAHVARAIAPGLGGERRALLAGIVLGEDEGLSDELRDNFKASGLYHLLAVSGQNITFLALGVIGLAWLLGIPRLAAEVIAIAAIAAYVLAVGWQPSVVRAGVAGGLASLAWLLSRPRDRWHFLALGAAVLLGLDPSESAGARLPALVRGGGRDLPAAAEIAARTRGLPADRVAAGRARGLDRVCGGNGADPVVPVRQRPGLLAACERARDARHRASPRSRARGLADPAAVAVGRGRARVPERVGRRVHRRVRAARGRVAARTDRLGHGGLRLARSAARAPPPATAAALAPADGARLRRDDRPRAPRLAALSSREAAAAEGAPDHVLDVGQGDAVLLQVPEGAVLVDQGPPEADVAQQLRGLGVRRLAAVVLTHPQRDHIGGAETVLRRVAVERVLDPRLAASGPYERAALAAAAERGVAVTETRAGDAFRLGRLRLRVLWPDRAGSPAEDPNLLPVVMLASYGEVDALLTADAETEVTARLLSRRVEILKVAHHGSADPGLPSELRELRPAIAVISCGRGNDYGHPTASTLTALRESPGLSLFRTDEDGQVVIESDGRRISVRTGR